jgi:hypothetical protein
MRYRAWSLELILSGVMTSAMLITRIAQAAFGTEMLPLLQLVSGQVREIEALTQQLGATREQTSLLFELNQGVERVVSQIQSMEAIVERSQGLNPSAVQSLSQLNDLMRRARSTQADLATLIALRSDMADQAIAQSAIQSDTAYRMGQEMVASGSDLARESQTASPGRAAQITASAQSAQMLSQGVELQTLAQIAQLQALQLDFQKAQASQLVSESDQRQQAFQSALKYQNRRLK